MLTLLLVLSIAEPVPSAWPPPSESVASAFVRALGSGEVVQLAALATEAAVASEDWEELRHAVERYDCISIRAHSVELQKVTETEAALVVTTKATAFARGNRAPLRFPKRWHIVAVPAPGGWKLQSILSEEKVIARRLMAMPSLTEEMFLAEVGSGDLERILIEFLVHPGLYAEEATGIAKARLAGTIARKRGFVMPELVSLLEESLVLSMHQKQDRAVEVAERMVAFADAHALPDGRATALFTTGVFDWQGGRFEAALDRFAIVASLMDEVEDPRGPMKALYMRLNLLTTLGRYREVLASATTLAGAAGRFSWPEGEFLASVVRSSIFSLLQDERTTAHFARQGLRIAERMRNEGFITVGLVNLASAEEALGNGAEAARLRQQIVARARSAGKTDQMALATLHLSLAGALAQARRHGEAEAELRTALAIVRNTNERLLEANIVQALAQLRLAEGRPAEGLRFAEEADALDRRFGATVNMHRGATWAIRSTLGSALRAVGRDAEAEAALRSSIDLIEATRSGVGADEIALSSFLRDKADPYLELISLHVARGKELDALIVSERFRARALATAAVRGNVDPLRSMTDADRKRYDAFQETISDLNRKLLASGEEAADTAIREQLGHVRAELRAFLSEVYAARADIRHRSVDDAAIVLADERVLPDAGEIVLSFSVHEDQTYAFAIERDGDELDVSVERIAVRKADLEERIRKFVGRIERRDLDYRRDARSLHDLLLAPFAARIRGKRLLYVIPDGVLWRLPFQALQRPDGKYVAEVVALAYTPSLMLLRNERLRNPAEPARSDLLAIADPALPRHTETMARATHRSADLGPLPDARTEVQAIRRTYDRNSRVLLGPDATESAVKSLAPQFRILHFATHGILDDRAPMYSALVLAGSETEDGLLEAREVIGMDLVADLAILSACESAGGDVTPGEGIIGMSWALMVAGCRNTVVSQWKVESRSTAALMMAFHRQAARGGGYAFALQRAQRELMQQDEFSHPYYWSSFVLVATSQ